MNQRSKSTLFLIEQLFVVAVFAICSAACVRILTSAYFTARESKDVINAVLVAKNGAESYKAANGDIEKAADILGGVTGSVDGLGAAIVYYDNQWRICGRNDAHYIFSLTSLGPEALSPPFLSSKILVGKLTGESLVTFTVAVNDSG